MKITEMHVYGFGKIIEMNFSEIQSMQVIFGKNEAGKSTLTAFIHAILFGFPSKLSAELRYEPKSHSNYGGKLILETKSHGRVVIERMKGKAAGDVTVQLEDGREGGEELLKKILNGINKSSYQSIFSFNLQGLQNVGKVKTEDLGKYLFAAGTTGTDDMIRVEQQLQKELDLLFKPGGRKPVMNQLLETLKEKDRELKKAKSLNSQYDLLQEKKANLENASLNLRKKIRETHIQLQETEAHIKDWPLYKEKAEIIEELKQYGEQSFPADGLARLDKLEDKLRSAKSELSSLKLRREEMEAQLSVSMPNESIINNEEEITYFMESWQLVSQWKEEASKDLFELEKCQEQILRLKKELHYSDENVRHLSQIDLGMNMKEKLRSAVRENLQLQTAEQGLKSRLTKEKAKVAETEKKCDEIEAGLLPEDEFRKLSDQQALGKGKWQAEYERIQDQLLVYEKLKKGSSKAASSLPYLLFILLFAAFIITGFFLRQPVIMAGSFIGFLAALLLLGFERKKGRQIKGHSEMRELQERARELEGKLAESHQNHHAAVEYERQLKRREEWKQQILELERQQSRLQETGRELSEMNHLQAENEERLNQIKNELQLKSSFSSEQLMDAFNLIEKLAEYTRQIKLYKDHISFLSNKAKEWEADFHERMRGSELDVKPDTEGMIRLKTILKREKENQATHGRLMSLHTDISAQEAKWQAEYNAAREVIEHLLSAADVKDMERFREKGLQHIHAIQLKDRLSLLREKLPEKDNHFLNNRTSSLRETEEIQNELREDIKNLENQAEQFQADLAEVSYQISVLEEGGTYTQKLHEFYQLRSEFNDRAKEWSKVRLAKELLSKTINHLKEERFPKVIKAAESYFQTLTGDRYIHIFLQEEGNILVERQDHVLFEPAELSQATAEQLYISLRFALIFVLREESPFPIIIDDGFVNFDKERTSRILKLLIEMSQYVQVIFFTCHEHLLTAFPEKNRMNLSKTLQEIK